MQVGLIKMEICKILIDVFKVDSLSTVAGSFFCMPVMTTYLESASGVEDGR